MNLRTFSYLRAREFTLEAAARFPLAWLSRENGSVPDRLEIRSAGQT
jgi:hypothetical protein